jgi:hypothetical protein
LVHGIHKHQFIGQIRMMFRLFVDVGEGILMHLKKELKKCIQGPNILLDI